MKQLVSLVFMLPLVWAEKGVDRKNITVFFSDAVIPQFVDGDLGGDNWKTTIILVNLSDHNVRFNLQFWRADGGPLSVRLSRGRESLETREGTIDGTIPRDGLWILESAGNTWTQGWAELNPLGELGGVVIIRRRPGSGPDYEVTVPISSRFDNRFIVPFDNRDPGENEPGFVTAVALVNPSSSRGTDVAVTFRDENGREILRDEIRLGIREQKVFVLADCYAGLEGRSGVAEFYTGSAELSGMALRANWATGAFVSFHALSTLGR